MLNKLQNKLILIFAVLLIAAMVISQLATGSQLTNTFKQDLDETGFDEAKNLTQITDLRINNYAKDILHFSKKMEMIDIFKNIKKTDSVHDSRNKVLHQD